MAEAKKRSNLLEFALIFATIYLLTQIVLRTFFPQQFGGDQGKSGVLLRASNVTVGHHPMITVDNRNKTELKLADRCPLPPLDIFVVENPSEPGEKLTPISAKENAVPCEAVPAIAANTSVQINLAAWQYSIFGNAGTYEAHLPPELLKTGSGAAVGAPTASGAVTTEKQGIVRFKVSEPGPLTKIFRTFITKPFLNVLIFIANLLPDHNLGLAIILLTLLVKLLLFIPTQHAMEGQKKMQMLQPKLEALKEKYKGDAQRINEETMKLWKEHKVNPMQSCLPTLIQFPILIGLFYTVRDGSTLELSKHLIYPMYQHLTWNFGTSFLGLNLLKPNLYILPPLLVLLQFAQMKLTFAITERKKRSQEREKIVDVTEGKAKKEPASSSKMQQQMMMYGLPFLIGFFALRFPAAVSIYWGVSTLFAIGQQIIVNREHIRP